MTAGLHNADAQRSKLRFFSRKDERNASRKGLEAEI